MRIVSGSIGQHTTMKEQELQLKNMGFATTGKVGGLPFTAKASHAGDGSALNMQKNLPREQVNTDDK